MMNKYFTLLIQSTHVDNWHIVHSAFSWAECNHVRLAQYSGLYQTRIISTSNLSADLDSRMAEINCKIIPAPSHLRTQA